MHGVVEALVLDRELRPNGVALALFGKTVDAIGQHEQAGDDARHQRDDSGHDPFRLSCPNRQNLVGRLRNDGRQWEIRRLGDRHDPIGAVNGALLVSDAVATASDILLIGGAAGDVRAEHEFDLGRARHQRPIGAKQFDRPLLAKHRFGEHIAEHGGLHEAARHAEKGAVGGGDALRHADARHAVERL